MLRTIDNHPEERLLLLLFCKESTATDIPGRLLSAQAFPRGGAIMTITMAHLQPLVALIAGVLILLVPRLLNYIVAIYLIIFGLLGLHIFRF